LSLKLKAPLGRSLGADRFEPESPKRIQVSAFVHAVEFSKTVAVLTA
jgi:hypothetical protein